MKKKISFIIVNRANYARVRFLIKKLNANKNFKVDIILVSSPLLKKYGDLEKVIRKDGLKITSKFFTHIEGESLITMTKSTGLLLLELSSAFESIKPDMVFLVGDRYEILAAAIAANYMNIFLVHLQGGELTGSVDENVRHAVTKLSHLHLVNTKKAKRIVRQLGENPKMIFNVGCPSIDNIKKINFKKIKVKQPFGIGHNINFNKPYYVFLVHPVTTKYKQNTILIQNFIETAKRLDSQIIWIWPNNDAGANFITKKIRSFREKYNLKINFMVNFDSIEYLKIIKDCECLIGNSSSAIREGSYLGIKAVNVGDRQQQREQSNNVINSSLSYKEIIKSIKKIKKKKISQSKLYGDGNSIKRIESILLRTNEKIIKKFYEI
tara:strand:- start:1953 stop:3092 length:1140 start_codon:yes stop_codon:yes gene_type:complete